VGAIYYALPPGKGVLLLRDEIWALYVRQVEQHMPAAQRLLCDLIEATPASDVGYALAHADVAATA